uniref:Uncharacterized protein n=1 Tax=Anguilla anguilla TaxID=7936 RepID=A0A0E9XKP7_ANGAN
MFYFLYRIPLLICQYNLVKCLRFSVCKFHCFNGAGKKVSYILKYDTLGGKDNFC